MLPQPAATHLVGIFFKFAKDFEGLSIQLYQLYQLTRKQRENAETELQGVLVLTLYTPSPMPLKADVNQYGPIFIEFSVFRPAAEEQ